MIVAEVALDVVDFTYIAILAVIIEMQMLELLRHICRLQHLIRGSSEWSVWTVVVNVN